jgi:hypothetical protein
MLSGTRQNILEDVGFRYGQRLFTHVLDFMTGDEDRIQIHEYTPLLVSGSAGYELALQFRLGDDQ